MTVKDSKVPYIFLASGDEGEKTEPAGRKVFELTLLAVLVARATSATVTYSEHTSDETAPREYELTAEILMPAVDFRRIDLRTLDVVPHVAGVFKVTPSAVGHAWPSSRTACARRSQRLPRGATEGIRECGPPPWNKMLAVNALKYSGIECSRRMLAMLDAERHLPGRLLPVMFSNTLRTTQQISEFRAAIG
jgi:hypothetical protein